jgi:hypothetical protein
MQMTGKTWTQEAAGPTGSSLDRVYAQELQRGNWGSTIAGCLGPFFFLQIPYSHFYLDCYYYLIKDKDDKSSTFSFSFFFFNRSLGSMHDRPMLRKKK